MDWQTFEFGDTEVRVLAPADAEFDEQDGLPEGMHNLTWSPRDAGFFGVAAGSFTVDGVLGGDGVRVDSDEETGLAGLPGRRVAYRVERHRPRRQDESGWLPERTWTEVGDLLFVPGDDQNVRIGYRVDENDTELRETFARMLDRVEVRRDDRP
jgi:hypothetical protein